MSTERIVTTVLAVTYLVANIAIYMTNGDQSHDYSDQSKLYTGPEEDADYIKKLLKEVAIKKADQDKDGLVSYEELKKYLEYLSGKNLEFSIEEQWLKYSPQIHEVFSWEGYEPEKKEVLTWDQYFNMTYPELMGIDIGIPIHREQDTEGILHSEEAPQEKATENIKEITTTPKSDLSEEELEFERLKKMAFRADVRWKLADENGDTLLTKGEFKYLLHPDMGHEGLQELFVQEATEDMDTDRDGKIDMSEYLRHVEDMASPEEKKDENWLHTQKTNFGRFLDKNKDGSLDIDELRSWFVPSKEKVYSESASRLLAIGDSNDDKKLSTVEILENYVDYMGLIPPEYWTKKVTLVDQAKHDEL